jgi:GTP cyclohydrolase I
LLDTPKRVEKAYGKLFEGYNQKVEDVMTVFENESE